MLTSEPRFLLVHICCSVDSHHFLTELRACLSATKLIGYFYNPNIHPEEEYQLRLLDVRRSCRLLGIPLIEESYDPRDWLKASLGLEHHPEKGERCSFCFDFRLEKSAQKAEQLGCDSFTTTLLTSPMKSTAQLFAQGEAIEARFPLRFFPLDARSKGGTALQQQRAKESNLYRQNYCGCLYALQAQRERAHKTPLELSSPLSRARYEEGLFALRRRALEERDALETQGTSYHWGKEKRLLWRNLSTLLYDSRGESIPCHTLAYSMLKGRISLQVERHHEGIAHFDKEGIRALDLASFSRLIHRAYDSLAPLIYDPPSLDEELALRIRLGDSPYSTSPILITKTLPPIGASYKLTLSTLLQEESVERVWQL